MKVFKFGGASVNSVDRIQNVKSIIQNSRGEKLLIVVSAMGKTTNALEKVAEAFYAGNRELALTLFSTIKENHLTYCKYLLVKNYLAAEAKLGEFFTEVEWLLHDNAVRSYDYYYDQIVCVGELLSTAIIDAYLNESDIKSKWVDVRDLFRTDDRFRDATIDWTFTQDQVVENIIPLFGENDFIVTQGYIGSTSENESTTLGREGSDYTAAAFANMLNAESVTIWKDVEGVMNADPRLFPDAVFLSELNYEEVIEMAYYGAQVIHPKTIKPLQNKQIPLYVKCFLHPEAPGTTINRKGQLQLPPIFVVKRNQVLMRLTSKNLSFVSEKPMADLYQALSDIHLKPSLIQTGAINIYLCLDDISEKIDRIAFAVSDEFDVTIERDLELLTIRHSNPNVVAKMILHKHIELRQDTGNTVQLLFRA